MATCTCGKTLDGEASYTYTAFDLQKGYEELEFCSIQCREEWMRQKKIGMWIALILGVILSIVLLIDGNATLAIPLLFLPYSIRQLKGLISGGEFLSFCVVLLCSITVIYPAYKLYQEISEYRRIAREDELLRSQEPHIAKKAYIGGAFSQPSSTAIIEEYTPAPTPVAPKRGKYVFGILAVCVAVAVIAIVVPHKNQKNQSKSEVYRYTDYSSGSVSQTTKPITNQQSIYSYEREDNSIEQSQTPEYIRDDSSELPDEQIEDSTEIFVIPMTCLFTVPDEFLCISSSTNESGGKENVFYNSDIDMTITVSEESIISYVPADFQDDIVSWFRAKYNQDCAERYVTYNVFSEKQWYVVSGYSGENIFYDKLMFSTDNVYEIGFLYPTNYSEEGEQYLLNFLNSWSV